MTTRPRRRTGGGTRRSLRGGACGGMTTCPRRRTGGGTRRSLRGSARGGTRR